MGKCVAGSGRGNKGVFMRDIDRPDCPDCETPFISYGKNRWKCTECGYNPTKTGFDKRLIEENFSKLGYNRDLAESNACDVVEAYESGCRSFVVTSAQNNTGVFKAFLESLKVYCKHKKAKLIIIPSHYKNVTAWTKDDEKEWCREVEPYLCHGDIELGNILIRSHIKINATSVFPLQGKQAHGGNHWTVFGSPQHAHQCVPTPADLMPKKMFTTGSCTKRNYSQTDIGEKGAFNHVFGALTINFRDGVSYPFVRQINADDRGAFYDLDKRYTPKGVTDKHKVEALVPGDEHENNNIVKKETYFNKDAIAKVLKPKYIVRHDLLDGYAISHHHEKNPLLQFRKFHNGTADCRKELESCVQFINESTPSFSTNLLVASNHSDHLCLWLNRANPNKDFINAQLIHELRALQLESALKDEDKTAFQLYSEDKIKAKTKWLSRNEPFLIKDVDVSQHGDVGVNGSRGSARGLAKSTFKMTVGHSHSPGIVHGVYQVGTSTGRLEYERGLSTHCNTHCIQYKNGKRTLIDIIDGHWREK